MPTDPDRGLDRLLKAELAGGRADAPTPPSAACVDAETFAAWAEGALTEAEAATVEWHLADCARCQALAAAFARTEPSAASVLPFQRRLSLAKFWIPIAAGTVAATLLVWTMWPSHVSKLDSLDKLAQNTAAPVTVAPPPPPPPPAAATSEDKKELMKSATQNPETHQDRAQPADKARADMKRNVAAPAATTEPAPKPAAPPPVAAPTGAVQGLPQSSITLSGISTANTTSPDRADTIPRTLNESVTASAVIAQFSSQDQAATMTVAQGQSGAATGGGGAGGGRGGGRGGGGGGRAGAAGAVAAPAFRAAMQFVSWRIWNSGLIERSTDAGATWNPVVIDPLVTGITSGVAPSPQVCWLVGRNGDVLLSTDGLRFVRVSSPAPVPITSISATGPRDATVVTSDGRTFVTSDGGQTWTIRTP